MERTALRPFADSPDCEECASSTITANREPARSVADLAITGNFCNVVMITCAFDPARAPANCFESRSIRSTTPGV